ncbi:hypothetical protein GCM10010400_47000 [Streptomyces aculeolatus]|uniref:hypothetical protein n=1 Tax=Streptomyces aculeolatus TaxID=270689 RepID=UPI001CEDF1EE|nr:hypothetical protein [Streptomyces aculeolatus]
MSVTVRLRAHRVAAAGLETEVPRAGANKAAQFRLAGVGSVPGEQQGGDVDDHPSTRFGLGAAMNSAL